MRAKNPNLEHYANALISLGEAAGSLHIIEQDMASVLETVVANEEISRFFANNRVRNAGKISALEELMESRIHPVLLHFLLILQTEDKFHELRQIAEMFLEKVSWQRKETSGILTCAQPIADNKVAEIEAEAGKILGTKVHLRVVVKPELIGGLVVRVGDFVMDGTIDSELENFKSCLLS